jgi:pyridoxal biosynthesis lyase PdxS
VIIEESEVLTPAEDRYHVDRRAFKAPCGRRARAA